MSIEYSSAAFGAQQEAQQQRESQAAKDAALSGSTGLDLASLSRIAVKPASAAAPPVQQQPLQQQQHQQQLGALAASSAQESQAMAALYAGMATSQVHILTLAGPGLNLRLGSVLSLYWWY